ncbi:ImuA family protein [Microvirga arsenatis]|uniref:Damage-inducible mutagenesis protein n=1 Tax=Microvirga arsenatis TaxID=2692265 RepID=A0ABW9Z467_9HYPH|nr:damage-inducible mutagenesis protein [Microvirga arsenatis]NBJ13816.1 damage-inducible mutagenesis protein [Microvirga arsenatis]NBJ27260.1 damage-inducible mutagenesis protein [Microvirga arsenatis]
MDARREVIESLRRQIERLHSGSRPRKALPFGVTPIDGHLPAKGLASGALHEVIESGPAAEFAGAATLFAAGILARLKGPVLWCLTRRDLFAPGLMQVGLHPNRVIYAETGRDGDVLPLIEEGLHEKGLGAVVGEVTKLGLTASRRLQLAAEASGVTALVIRRWWTVAQKDLTHAPTAALTRWRITPAVSDDLPAQGLGRGRWQVELMRCRGAEPCSWIVEACDAQGRLALPSNLAHRSHPAQVRGSAGG